MPIKQLTHKPISVTVETYDEIQLIAKHISDETGVPVSTPAAIRLLVNEWKTKHPIMKAHK